MSDSHANPIPMLQRGGSCLYAAPTGLLTFYISSASSGAFSTCGFIHMQFLYQVLIRGSNYNGGTLVGFFVFSIDYGGSYVPTSGHVGFRRWLVEVAMIMGLLQVYLVSLPTAILLILAD